MSFFTSVATTFPNASNAVLHGLSDDYKDLKVKLDDIGSSVRMRGIIALVIGVALAVLGIGLLATGNPLGLIPLGLSLPLFYFGYNNLKMGSNIKEMAFNPMPYLKEQSCHNKLSEGTFLFDFMVKDWTKTILYGTQK